MSYTGLFWTRGHPTVQSTHCALVVLWRNYQGEDSDDGDVQDELTVPHEVSAELKGVVVVGLVLVVELPLLQLLPVVT